MAGKKKEPQPNYEILKKSLGYAIQENYNNYKKAMKKYLDCTGYDMNGHMYFVDGWKLWLDESKRLDKEIVLLKVALENLEKEGGNPQ